MFVSLPSDLTGRTTRQVFCCHCARVLEVSGNITTAYVGGHYEKVSNVVTPTKYYMLSGKRIAVRNASGLYYLHGDHPSTRSGCTSVQAA
jgi:hypothetical protein